MSGHLLASGWPATALLGPPGRWESFPGGSTTAKEKSLLFKSFCGESLTSVLSLLLALWVPLPWQKF